MALQFETKGDLYRLALSELAISGITAPVQTDDEQTAISVLESLMYELLEAWAIDLNYNFEREPQAASNHGMPFGVYSSIVIMLALRLSKHYMIPPSQALLNQANTASTVVSGYNAQRQLRPVQYPRRMPRGGGNTLRWNRWQRFYRKPARPDIDGTSLYLKIDEINDFVERYEAYLIADELIDMYDAEVTEGLTLVSSDTDGLIINYRLQGKSSAAQNNLEQVKFTVTTSTGRVDERIVDVKVTDARLRNSLNYRA
ncbi:hypothetical protein AB832_08140 [Flavobacteriaceae bacterium (ex Bugula neritina AB1)]|jgi:hypothetical protein|nr:hypothetical protein AB832_08140 [Flavobacteriaceae bacterium (ex Bugula neritina AB1)]